ncbi:MAG: FAD-binding oxidoreductase [Dehalococcoidia bacterium]
MARMVLPIALLASAAVVAGTAAPRLRNGAKRRKNGSVPAGKSWRGRITSHETFTHDSLDSLGYDWERIANPAIAPRYPFKVYMPQNTEEIVRAVKEAKALDERLTIRSKGHSSNDLVVAEGGAVLVTEKLNRVLELDEQAMTVTVQAGAVSAEIDDWLALKGYGLPIIGDHNHITVGGFAAVGGISPASHRFGMFVDNVERIEYVDWDGTVIACSRTEQPERFHRVLAGLGQFGVMATLTCRIIPIDKYGTILKNDQTHYRNVEDFIEGSGRYIQDPGDALYERGVWFDFPLPGGRRLTIGQFSMYCETDQSTRTHLRNRMSYGYLHRIGYVAGRLPAKLDKVMKYVGSTGVLFSPTYASIKNIEFFTDKILDSTVGDPTRMLIILAPLDRYADLFRDSYALTREFRERYNCFTFISVYVKSIRSPYLAQGGEQDRFCELMFYLGIDPKGMTDAVLDDLVSQFDDICIRHQGFRYMHSKTVKDPERRRLIDPNAAYAQAGQPTVSIPAD